MPNTRIEIDSKRYGNVSVEVSDEPVFVLDNSSNGGSVTLATLGYLQDVGYYVKENDMTWHEVADVIYIRLPDGLGLREVWLENQTTNTDLVITHARSKTTGLSLFRWKN